ncbi:unnamed protein product [Toxocara canis]|uniref:PH domain-containing protein n=1 Tax=Toxocara canis TaxID=6265 RepID=A0A183UEQ5_TOXCA|nr:unnamed protein product [Toxocara canis]
MNGDLVNALSGPIFTSDTTTGPALMACTNESVKREEWIQKLNSNHVGSCAPTICSHIFIRTGENWLRKECSLW